MSLRKGQLQWSVNPAGRRAARGSQATGTAYSSQEGQVIRGATKWLEGDESRGQYAWLGGRRMASQMTREVLQASGTLSIRSVCDHHFFGNAMAAPPIFMSFGTLIPNLTSKISNSKKIDRTGHLKFLKLQWGTQKSKLKNLDKRGHLDCK